MNLDAATYRHRVVLALARAREPLAFGDHDEKLLILGRQYGVGPIDCALQIINDSADDRERAIARERRATRTQRRQRVLA